MTFNFVKPNALGFGLEHVRCGPYIEHAFARRRATQEGTLNHPNPGQAGRLPTDKIKQRNLGFDCGYDLFNEPIPGELGRRIETLDLSVVRSNANQEFRTAKKLGQLELSTKFGHAALKSPLGPVVAVLLVKVMERRPSSAAF